MRAWSGLGGLLVATFVVGLFVWGTLDANRRGQQEQQIESLRQRIVHHVESMPDRDQPATLDDLRRAGMIQADDDKLIADTGLVYHPIASSSPPDALVFVRATSTGERRYYKGIATEYVVAWTSPDGAWRIRSEPASPGGRTRRVSFVHVTSDRVVESLELEVVSVHPLWAPDGRHVALVESRREPPEHLNVFALADGEVKYLAPPDGLHAPDLLPPADLALTLTWHADRVQPEKWIAADRLEVISYGSAVVEGPAGTRNGLIAIRQRSVLSVGATMDIVTSTREHYERQGVGDAPHVDVEMQVERQLPP